MGLEAYDLEAYDIVGRDGAWHVDHDGTIRNAYQTVGAGNSGGRPSRIF